MLYREALGLVLRQTRLDKNLTLRQASARACMALGYLSEVERGHKELSSELLRNLARGLNTEVSELIISTGLRLAGVVVPDTVADLVDEYADLIPQN